MLTYKSNNIAMCGTQGYPKCWKTKSWISRLSNAVSTIPIACLDQNLQKFETFMILFNFKVFTKMWIFALKIHKKVKFSTKCPNTPRYPNHACDTAFESPDIILSDTNIFGYHSGTYGTQKKYFTIECWN